MSKITVGQKLFVVQKVYRHKDVPRTGWEEVTRVARKYFYTGTGYGEKKYSLETMREANDGNYQDQAYLSEADYQAVLERDALIGNINSMVRGWGWMKDIPTDKLETIYNILKEHE